MGHLLCSQVEKVRVGGRVAGVGERVCGYEAAIVVVDDGVFVFGMSRLLGRWCS